MSKEIICDIYECNNPAKYVVNNYGSVQNLCWVHLRALHVPENDDNIKCIGNSGE